MRSLFRCAGLALLLAPIAPSMRADATLRYHTDIQTSGAIGIAAPLNQVLGGMRDMVIRIKGNKASSLQGNISSIMDLRTQELTMVDSANKRFATIPAGQYAEQAKIAVPGVPEQARAALASMQTNIESRSTGRTEVIQGIQAEEHEFVLTVDMAMPAGPRTPAPLMKMIMQVWTAKPEEAQRVPALQEFKNYMASATSAMSPAEMLKQIVGAFPGLGDNLAKMIGEMTKDGSLTLRTHAELVMPLLAIMSQQIPPQPGQALPPGLDPNAPVMQMTQELVELSGDQLSDALFQVPADYQPGTLAEILKGAISAAAPPQFKQ